GRVATPARLTALEQHASRAVRLGAVLALREAASGSVAEFLADPDPQVASEAARTGLDLELPGAMATLASMLPGLRPDLRIAPYVRRALHAALRLGGAAQAEQVAAFAADSLTDSGARAEALAVLGEWDQPGPEDGVLARGAPLPARPAGLAGAAIRCARPGSRGAVHARSPRRSPRPRACARARPGRSPSARRRCT